MPGNLLPGICAFYGHEVPKQRGWHGGEVGCLQAGAEQFRKQSCIFASPKRPAADIKSQPKPCITNYDYLMNKHPLSQFTHCPTCGADGFAVRNEKAKRCDRCGFVYYFNPSAAVVAVIVDCQNQLLVATRAHPPAEGTLDLPGGFVDMDETLEQALAREVCEETGLVVTDSLFLFSLPNRYPYSRFDVHTVDSFFLCRVANFNKVVAQDDVAALRWISMAELNPEAFGLESIAQGIKKILTTEVLNSEWVKSRFSF